MTPASARKPVARRARSPRPSCRRRRTRAPRRRRRRRRRRSRRARVSNTSARTMLGMPGQRARAGAGADGHAGGPRPQRSPHFAGAHEVTQDRGAGRRDALAGDAVVAPRDSRRGARWSRAPAPAAMPCAVRTRPPPSGSARRGPARPVQVRRDASCRDDIHERIPVGELVEMHVVDGRAVHARLGVGERRQQCQRVRRACLPTARLPRCGGAGRRKRFRTPRDPRRDSESRPPRRCRNAARETRRSSRAGTPASPRPQDAPPTSSSRIGRSSAGSASTIAATNMSPARPPTRSRWIASAPGASSSAVRRRRGRHTGLRGSPRATRRRAASASASAASTEAIASTPVRLRSSASSPVV